MKMAVVIAAWLTAACTTASVQYDKAGVTDEERRLDRTECAHSDAVAPRTDRTPETRRGGRHGMKWTPGVVAVAAVVGLAMLVGAEASHLKENPKKHKIVYHLNEAGVICLLGTQQGSFC